MAQTAIEALDRLAGALEQTVAVGPRSNLAFLAALARAPAFRQGEFDTGFIDRHLEELGAAPQPLDKAAVALAAQELLAHELARIAAARAAEAPASPWDVSDGFQLSGTRSLKLPLIADGESVTAEIGYDAQGAYVRVGGESPAADAFALAAGEAVYVLRQGRQTKVTLRDLALDEAGEAGAGGLVRAPMHGKVLAVLVEQGAAVARGQRLAIIEAMKMEHTITAPIAGIVSDVAVSSEAQVAEGAKLMLIAPSGD